MRTVLLIGLGNVAVGYDETTDVGKVLTHAKAFDQHESFKLIGGVDILSDRRKRFASIYNLPVYADIGEAMGALDPNVVVVATSTNTHHKVIMKVFGSGRPQLILCEKPLAYELIQAEGIVNICEQNNCRLYVNYCRQSDPGIEEIKDRLKDGRIHTPIKGVVWYSKGLFNSGSHFLILLSDLLGEIGDVRVVSKGRLWRDIDPEPDLDVTFSRGRFYFISAREEDFFHNEFEIISASGRVRYESGGAKILWQGTEEDKIIGGYTRLEKSVETLHTGLDRAQFHVVDQLAVALDGEEARLCPGVDALCVQKVMEKIKSSYEE